MKNRKLILTIIGIFIVVLSLILFQRLGKTYLVTFNTQGGTIYQSLNIHLNDKVTRPNDPVLVGYVFEKWIDEDTGKDYDFNTPITKKTTIKAIYKEIESIDEEPMD